MKNNQNKTSDRKKEHIELCLHSDVSFRKSTGLENYEFKHNAITEIEIDNINFESEFLGKQISFPFLISSMTGGTHEAFELNVRVSEKSPAAAGSKLIVAESVAPGTIVAE